MNPEQLIALIAKPYRHVGKYGYDFCNGLLLAWLTSSPKMHADYDLATDEGADRWTWWWISGGWRATPGIADDVDRALLHNIHLDRLTAEAMRDEIPITPLLSLVYRNRSDLRQIFDLREAKGRRQLWQWWISGGREEYRRQLDWFAEAELHALHVQHDHGQVEGRRRELTPLLSAIWHKREDLQRVFDVASEKGVADLFDWWPKHGRREYYLPRGRPHTGPKLPAPGRGSSNRSADAPGADPVQGAPQVALIGYPKGEFGLGEDARMLRTAFDTAGISSVVINAPWHIMARQSVQEPSIEAAAAEFACDVMFYVLPPVDTVTLLNQAGPWAFSARRKIGFWQWEFERFPPELALAFNLVDEIWCHSEHSAKAFRAVTDKPVIKVPLPVFVPKVERRPRASFDLPEQAFVVFTAFDGASMIARKNPLASILAFQQAFPRGQRDARLIVKAMNTQGDSLWRECLRRAAVDDRIIIADRVMDHSDYFELVQSCDVVLSLHRSEGFGRLMAEAMALGVPVIASRYSGNLDFMTDENSWLVDGELISVLPGDYAFPKGQVWLEPTVAEAVKLLTSCANDRAEAQRRVATASATMVSGYSLDVCGKVYARLLGGDRAPSQ